MLQLATKTMPAEARLLFSGLHFNANNVGYEYII